MTANTEEKIEYVRLVGDERRVGDTLAEVSRSWRAGHERFLFVSPHDDDVALGAGIFLQLARREGVSISLAVVTDGAMGYCHPEQKETIRSIRRAETDEAYGKLGIAREDIHWLGFPDCRLANFQGRREALPDEPGTVAGFTGLQNSFAHVLRKVRPTQVFIPTHADLHPDHRIVHQELMISIFHACGSIWPELGPKLEAMPYVSEMAVYCDFPSPPQVRITAPRAMLETKLEAIGCFRSQTQIDSLIEVVRQGGPVEYLRSFDVRLYQPARYFERFNEPAPPMVPGR